MWFSIHRIGKKGVEKTKFEWPILKRKDGLGGQRKEDRKA